uniref:Nephrocystin 3-like N-terminal domain-containing protein n=1 Tax=Hucho hucho TaxID=62062 RepID=A0A4W5KFU5_9TELE
CFAFSDHDKRDSEGSIFLLCGERGCGKSSLAAWCLQEFRKKNPRIPAIPHCCGINSSSVDIRSVLRHITTELRLAHYGPQAEWSEGLQHHVKPRSFHVVVQAFSAAAALGPCVLVLDGLDRLTGTLGLSMQLVKDLRWLPDPLPPQCKILHRRHLPEAEPPPRRSHPPLARPVRPLGPPQRPAPTPYPALPGAAQDPAAIHLGNHYQAGNGPPAAVPGGGG